MLGATSTLQSTEPTLIYYVDLIKLAPVFQASLFWVNEEKKRADRIARFRKYYDGDHDVKLSSDMRKLLRITDPDDGFTINMMPSVVDTMADRCIVQSIDAVALQPADPTATEAADVLKDPRQNASAWIQEIMEENRFDILQGQVHLAAIRDGDAFMMASWDNERRCVRWTYEEAFDGSSGMLAYYKSRSDPTMTAAVKIWQVQVPAALTTYQSMVRVNIYYPDRIEKYSAMGAGMGFEPYIEDGETTHVHGWTDRNVQPLGIPVIHFRNGGRHNYGVSVLRNAMTPQNALNRFMYTAVGTAELHGFPVFVAIGHQPETKTITPAMIYQVGNTPLQNGETADLKRLEAGSLEPILSMIDKARHLIADITRTPSADLVGGDGKSGEYLKQLEIGLLGKVRTFQTWAGAAWESVADMSHKIQAAFGTIQPPEYKRFRTVWRQAQIRNDSEVVDNALKLDGVWGHEETLRQVASVADLDEDRIARIMARQEEIAAQQAADSVSVNPATGKVSVKEPPILIGAKPGNAAPFAGAKPRTIPNVAAISDAELAAVAAMHRKAAQ